METPGSHCDALSAPWHTREVAPSFDEVYARLRDPVWRLCRRFTRDTEEALDACQEIFLRVWRGLPAFRGEAKVETWVFQVAWNHLRTREAGRRRRPRAVEPRAGERGSVPLDVRDPRPGPERRAAAREELHRVECALARLPLAQRAVVWLRDGECLSYEEIARVLGVPVGTVRSRLARARAALRKELLP